MKRAIAAALASVCLALGSSFASAETLLTGTFGPNLPFGPFAPNEKIPILVEVTNSSLDRSISVCEGVCIGDGYTYSLGGWTSSPYGYTFEFGNGGDTSLGPWNGQIAGPLVAGETKTFIFGIYTPVGAVEPKWYPFWTQLQIFAATAERPMLTTATFSGNWMVAEPEPPKVPIPGAICLFASGLGALILIAKRRGVYRPDIE